jgi:hypothetical protein
MLPSSWADASPPPNNSRISACPWDVCDSFATHREPEYSCTCCSLGSDDEASLLDAAESSLLDEEYVSGSGAAKTCGELCRGSELGGVAG